MNAIAGSATAALTTRLERCYMGESCDWSQFYTPRQEMLNFATRYHLVYPALAYFIALKREPSRADRLRPQLDNIYRGLLEPRCWRYWHTELGEDSWPLEERNLTYAGRLATFVGFYIDAFGEPPAARIELDGRTTTYEALSSSLWKQMTASPSCGVSCYHHQSMVMCNAHLLINNLLHDRLFGTNYAAANDGWLATVTDNLVRDADNGPLFYFGTAPDQPTALRDKTALGADIWALFLMSGVWPEQVASWFAGWQRNLVHDGDATRVEVAAWEAENEFSCDALATAWAYCLAQELGQRDLAQRLRRALACGMAAGFDCDPYISGVVLLGEHLRAGAFRALIHGRDA